MSKNASVFTTVKMPPVNMNRFDLSHDHKLTMNIGELVPSMCLEVIPGDHVSLANESLVRLAPLVAPIMQRLDVYNHYFFVPSRILWKNWQNFITQTKVSGAVPAHPFLAFEFHGTVNNKLSDYLGVADPGLNPGASRDEDVSALPFAAYQLIYNEYYRDENLVAPLFAPGTDFTLVDGDNSASYAAIWGVLRKRAWAHDYFTSCLPFTQKGDPVELPVILSNSEVKRSLTGPPATTEWATTTPVGTQQVDNEFDPDIAGFHLYADNSNASSETTINDLRRALSIQKFLERLARAGTRFTEWIKGIFGTDIGDNTVQRPVYICGAQSPVMISEVLQTSESNSTPQATMAGHAVSVVNGGMGSYEVKEHGFMMCITSILPKSGYYQGMNRMWLKAQPFDYFTPDLAHLGEQAVFLRELYAYVAGANDEFGYLPTYSDYRYQPNRVSGAFKTSLDFWTMIREFASPPGLNQQFVECDNAQTDRVFAVTDPDVDHFYCDILHTVHARRPVPMFGTPGL